MNVNAFKCPHCGETMSQGLGPNWTHLDEPPGFEGASVVMLSCIDADCQAALGVYYVPAPPSS